MLHKNEIDRQRKGLLIVFEGVSGSGKTQSVKNMALHLKHLNQANIVVKWNSNRMIKTIVNFLYHRRLLAQRIYCLLQWAAFFIDYYIKVVPALKKNHIVIADRYVYTAMTRDVANGSDKSLSLLLSRFVRGPDIIFFQDTPLYACKKRIESRDKKLFHLNRKINTKICFDKTIYYLFVIRKEYLKIFSDPKIVKRAPVFYVKHYSGYSNKILREYIEVLNDTREDKVLTDKPALRYFRSNL